ncbi:MAG: peptidoglycan recognition protein family protein [Actinomycetota bacterium]
MRIVSRHEAGLAPPRGPIPRIRLPAPEGIFIHHTVTRVTADPAADWRYVQSIAFGRRDAYFYDVSYSFGVHSSGTILEGRGWGAYGGHTVDKAHGINYNDKSHAIVLIGNYHPPANGPDVVTLIQLEAVRWLIAEGIQIGAVPLAPKIRGHRDVHATACPGATAYALLPEFRKPWIPTEPPPPPEPEHATGEEDPQMVLIKYDDKATVYLADGDKRYPVGPKKGLMRSLVINLGLPPRGLVLRRKDEVILETFKIDLD